MHLVVTRWKNEDLPVYNKKTTILTSAHVFFYKECTIVVMKTCVRIP